VVREAWRTESSSIVKQSVHVGDVSLQNVIYIPVSSSFEKTSERRSVGDMSRKPMFIPLTRALLTNPTLATPLPSAYTLTHQGGDCIPASRMTENFCFVYCEAFRKANWNPMTYFPSFRWYPT
jgi:hypothetical protein